MIFLLSASPTRWLLGSSSYAPPTPVPVPGIYNPHWYLLNECVNVKMNATRMDSFSHPEAPPGDGSAEKA